MDIGHNYWQASATSCKILGTRTHTHTHHKSLTHVFHSIIHHPLMTSFHSSPTYTHTHTHTPSTHMHTHPPHHTHTLFPHTHPHTTVHTFPQLLLVTEVLAVRCHRETHICCHCQRVEGSCQKTNSTHHPQII